MRGLHGFASADKISFFGVIINGTAISGFAH
jgi:hypothetical protein